MAQLLARFELHLLLFVLALILFVKPVLIPAPRSSATAMWLAFFVPWAVVIAILACIGRAGRPAPPADPEG